MNILLVRLRLIGDVVFTTPLIRALRRQFPGARLSYLVEPTAAPVVSDNPHLDAVLVIQKTRGVRRVADDIRTANRLRAAHFDVAIDLHGGPRGAWLTWASRAPMRIGYTTRGRTWMYTHPVSRPADLAPEHSVLKQWALLRPLGIGPPDPARDAVEMALDPTAAASVDERLRALGVTPAHKVLVVHVSAGNPFRRWPTEAFIEFVVRVAQHDGTRRVLLISGPSERDAAATIAAAARDRLQAAAERVPVPPRFDVHELHALIARAAVYIGADSGPLHVAATTRTAVVALLGPTVGERCLPWRDPRWFTEAVDAGPLPCRPCRQRRCEPGDFRCLTMITPQQVSNAVERALMSITRSSAPALGTDPSPAGTLAPVPT
jgi:ADP-heptose:LPS heptosyltransferase